jgi:hypothetical protein
MAIIGAGGAVAIDVSKLQRAAVIVLAKKGDVIVGVGTIKAPRPEYAQRKAEDSGFLFPVNTPELGYVAVDDAHRGNHISDRVVAGLVATQGGRIFATTDNEFMKKTLMKAGFVERGKPWRGNRGILSLWIREC